MTQSPPQPVILILGGTGVFGSRLAKRLAMHPGLNLVIASRDGGKAAEFAAGLQTSPDTCVSGISLDMNRGLAERLCELHPFIVIHAAGPFQGQDYSVAETIIKSGAHYIDLADGRDYVLGFTVLDELCKSRGVVAVSGASSVPALSSAVVTRLAQDMRYVETIEFGINPGNRTPRGDAVIRAILSYCGQRIPGWDKGKPSGRFGWGKLRREAISGLGSRWFSDCDIPDIILFPRGYPGIKSVRFGAGLELSIMHLGLSLLSRLVRLGVSPRLDRFTPMLAWIARRLERFGTDEGGMFVRISGRTGESPRRFKSWSLVARNGDGPYVPIIATGIMTKKILAGTAGSAGAYICFNMIALEEFEREVRGLDIEMHFEK